MSVNQSVTMCKACRFAFFVIYAGISSIKCCYLDTINKKKIKIFVRDLIVVGFKDAKVYINKW